MKLLLLQDKQLYSDFILRTLSNIDPKSNVSHIESVDDLRQLSNLQDYKLAIVDTGLFDRASLEAIRILNAVPDPPEVLAIADVSDPGIVADTFKYQVMAYASNDDNLDEFEETIRKCLSDDRQYTRKTRKEMKRWVSQRIDGVSKMEVSKREREILRMICEEKTSVEIAEELFISEHTVLTHRKNLLKKVSAKNTVGLVKYAIAHKLITV